MLKYLLPLLLAFNAGALDRRPVGQMPVIWGKTTFSEDLTPGLKFNFTDTLTPCDSRTRGTIRWTGTDFEQCDGGGTWTAIGGGGGGGTVTSVAQTVPSFLSIAGSPVTGAGTLAITLSGTPILMASGSAAFPSYGYAGDPGTGWWRGGPGTLIASSGGANVIGIVANTLVPTQGGVANGNTLSPWGSTTSQVFYAGDGAAATPSISLTTENGTGFYKFGSSDLGVSVGGVSSYHFKSAEFTPAIFGGANLGSPSFPWSTIFSDTFKGLGPITLNPSSAGEIRMGSNDVTFVTNYVFDGVGGGTNSLKTLDNADGAGSNNITVSSGNVAAAGDSGGVKLKTGTVSGGARGKISMVDGTEGTSGYVWTSSDTLGHGFWRVSYALLNQQSLVSRNAADNGDIGLVKLTNTDEIEFGTFSQVDRHVASRFDVLSGGQINLYGGGAQINILSNGGGAPAVRFHDDDSSNFVGLKAPGVLGSNTIWDLMPVDGASGQSIITDGAGHLSFSGSPQGTVCGWYDVGSTTLISSCKGSDPSVSCPTGYTQKTTTTVDFCVAN